MKLDMDSTLSRGIATELQCVKDFVSLGYHCSIPYGNCARYDVVVDINNKLYKVQCKASSWSKDTAQEKVAFEFDARTTTVNTKKTTIKLYTRDEVDLFYTYFEGKSYLIPMSEMEGKTKFKMRYEYPSSGQKQGIHLEKDYQLDVQIERIKNKEGGGE